MRGVGFIVGLELMRDGEKRNLFDRRPQGRRYAWSMRPRCGTALILRLIGDRIVFAPPLVIEEDDLGEIGERTQRALDEVAGELNRQGALS